MKPTLHKKELSPLLAEHIEWRKRKRKAAGEEKKDSPRRPKEKPAFSSREKKRNRASEQFRKKETKASG